MSWGKAICKSCGEEGHYAYTCWRKAKKVPKQISDKQAEYNLWLEEVARPAVIERDGEVCDCEGGCSATTNLDLDHRLGKGSHSSLKKNIDNLHLLCRFPCHRNKTDGIKCNHVFGRLYE